MSTDALRSHPVFGPLRRMKGLAYLVLDEEQKVAVPKSGNRWRRIADIVEGMEWEVMKAYDASDALLGAVRNPDSGVDDDSDDDNGQPVTLDGLARVMTGLVKDVMREMRETFSVQQEGNARIVEGMAEANRAISESYALALRVQTAASVAHGAGEGAPEVVDMLKMALPMVIASQTRPAPQQPPMRPAVSYRKPRPVVHVPHKPAQAPATTPQPQPPPEVKPDGE